MKLIADSGSSKAEWIVLNTDGTTDTVMTSGINPFFQQTNDIVEQIEPIFSDAQKKQVTEVYFYGAGVIKGQTDQTIIDALVVVFPNATYSVEDDMLGAARALLGNEHGIACILGTGANSCLYSGNKIMDKVPTLGFILGDEGSGAYLGKIFLNHYFKRAMPADLTELVDKELGLEWPKVLQSVYKEAYPSRFLATFSKFIAAHKTHPFLHQMLVDAFSTFLQKNVMRYRDFKKHEVGFVGSVAHYYVDELKEASVKLNVKVGKVLQRPIDGLMDFHKE